MCHKRIDSTELRKAVLSYIQRHPGTRPRKISAAMSERFEISELDIFEDIRVEIWELIKSDAVILTADRVLVAR